MSISGLANFNKESGRQAANENSVSAEQNKPSVRLFYTALA